MRAAFYEPLAWVTLLLCQLVEHAALCKLGTKSKIAAAVQHVRLPKWAPGGFCFNCLWEGRVFITQMQQKQPQEYELPTTNHPGLVHKLSYTCGGFVLSWCTSEVFRCACRSSYRPRRQKLYWQLHQQPHQQLQKQVPAFLLLQRSRRPI